MKTMILVLALTLAATQPLAAWEDDSYEGANTAEEIRRLREDLRDARNNDRMDRAIEERSEESPGFAHMQRQQQEYVMKNLYGFRDE